MTSDEIKSRRKEISKKKSSVDSLRWYFNDVVEDLDSVAGKDYAQKHLEYLDAVEKKLTEEEDSLPIGHLYEGTYYKKRSDYYGYPKEEWYEKKEGKVFMRIDLISWKQPNDWGTYRYFYKDVDLKVFLEREDGRPVYSRKEVEEFQ